MSLSGTRPPPAVRITLGVLKAVSIVVGLCVSVLCLMSALAELSRTLWVQLVPALILALGLPLLLAERLAAGARGRQGEGLATDVLAAAWMGFAFLFVVGAFPATQPLLLREADLLAGTWAAQAAPAVRWLGRGGEPGRGEGERRPAGEGAEEAEEAEEEDAGAAGAAAQGPGGERDSGGGGTSGSGWPVTVQPLAEELPELGPVALLEQLAPSIVTISIRRQDRTVALASGVVIDERGRVATAASAVRSAASLAVKSAGGRWVQGVRVEGEGSGLAVLSVPAPPSWAPRARLGRAEAAEPGARLLVVGNPLGLEPTLAQGVLLGPAEQDGEPRLAVSAPISLSNVGGAVVDGRGVVVGVALYEAPAAGVVPTRVAPPGLAAPLDLLEGLVRAPEPGPEEALPAPARVW